MDSEKALISKVLQTQQAEKVISRGIEPEHFADPDNRKVYEDILEHVRKYKNSPSVGVIKKKHKDFQPHVTQDALDYIIDDFVNVVKYRKSTELGRNLMEAIDDPERVPNIELEFLEVARTLTEVIPSPKVERYSNMNRRYEEYMRRLKEGDVIGIPMGIPTFDEETLGIQPPELVTVAAFLGVGKSTFMQHVFFQVYLQDKTPMMISLEMGADQLFRKWDTMATSVEYHAMKALELGEGDLEIWKEVAEKAAEASAEKDIIVIDDIGKCTPDKVMAETIRHKPDLVGIDYVNLMKTPRGISAGQTWEKITHITRELKYNARTLQIPILSAAQGNRESAKGVTLETLAHSISVGQDSDIVIGLHQDEDMVDEKRMEVGLLKNRDGKKARTEMYWNLDTMTIREQKFDDLMPPRDDKVEA